MASPGSLRADACDAGSLRLICGSRLDLFESLPVEGDSVAGPVWREGKSFLNRERLGDKAFEPETVRFEIGAVRTGSEEMNGHVMRAMAGHGQVEGFRQMRDL